MIRRGAILLVVLMLIVAMAAGLTALLAGVRGQSVVVDSIIVRQQQRLAARSAVIAITAELADAREEVLGGAVPELSNSELVLRYEDDESWAWELVSDDMVSWPISLAGRLDVNNADSELLGSLFDGDAELVAAIESARPIRTPGHLRKTLAELISDEDEFNRLIAMLTVSSADNPVRSGAGGQAGTVGQPRVALASGEDSTGGLSPEAEDVHRQLSAGNWNPASRADMARGFVGRSVPEDEWDLLLDTFKYNDNQLEFGLIDLNSASADVLECLPCLDEEHAQQLVDIRESISDEDRTGVMWPVRQGVLDVSEYAQCIDYLGTRSLQYKLRLHVVQDLGLILEYDDAAPEVEPPNPIQLEIVVDLSGNRPRLAYLRDISYLAWEPLRSSPEQDDLEDIDTGPGQSPEAESFGSRSISPTSESQEVNMTSGLTTFRWGRHIPGKGE